MGSGKTAAKTARSPLTGAEIPLGNHPGNTGGKKGRSGRKPQWWRRFCIEVLDDEATREAIRQAAQDSGTNGYAALIKMLASYAAGVPPQKVELMGEDGGPIETKDSGEADHVEWLKGELARLTARQAAGEAVKQADEPGRRTA